MGNKIDVLLVFFPKKLENKRKQTVNVKINGPIKNFAVIKLTTTTNIRTEYEKQRNNVEKGEKNKEKLILMCFESLLFFSSLF